MNEKLLKKLLTKASFNPYSLKYDPDAVIGFFEENESVLDSNDLFAIVSNFKFNEICRKYFELIYEVVKTSNLKYTDFIKSIIFVANNELLRIEGLIAEGLSNFEEIQPIDAFKISPFEKGSGLENMEYVSAIEMFIDGCSEYIQHIKRYIVENEFNPLILNEKEKIDEDEIHSAITLSCFHYLFKEMYNDSVHGNGDYIVDDSNKMIGIKFDNQLELRCFKSNHIRHQDNMHSLVQSIVSMEDKSDMYKIFIDRGNLKVIENVIVSDGRIVPVLSDSFSQSRYYVFVNGYANILSHYSFIVNEALPSTRSMSVLNIIDVFSSLQDLSNYCHSNNINDGKCFIKENILLNYLSSVTGLSSLDIRSILDLIIFDVDSDIRLNLWSTPILKTKGSYVFCYLPLETPVYLYLIDNWLVKSGFNMKKRGDLFEKFVVEMINTNMTENNRKYQLISGYKFDKGTRELSEADIILVLEESIFVIECKCIKYPLNSRERYSSMLSLRKGASQVKANIDKISKGGLKGNSFNKSIYGFICTPFPYMSGYNVDGVPVIDTHLLESYLSSGVDLKIETKYIDDKVISRNESISQILYRTDKEFDSNFYNYVVEPPIIKEYLAKVGVYRHKQLFNPFSEYSFEIDSPFIKK